MTWFNPRCLLQVLWHWQMPCGRIAAYSIWPPVSWPKLLMDEKSHEHRGRFWMGFHLSMCTSAGWWFQTCFFLHHIWDDHPHEFAPYFQDLKPAISPQSQNSLGQFAGHPGGGLLVSFNFSLK